MNFSDKALKKVRAEEFRKDKKVRKDSKKSNMGNKTKLTEFTKESK